MGADEYAVVHTVTKTADTNDGTCDADCSLREAVGAANGDGADSLIIIPAGTYPLTRTGTGEDSNSTGDLDINTGDIAILGAGSGSTIIDGGAIDRVFHQPWWQGITFIVKDVKITNGDPGADAGGCLNVTNSPLYIIDSIIDSCGNSVDATDGGAVYINGGALTVTGSTFSNNDTSTMGGAIMMYNESLSIDNSTFSNNSSGGGGGAVRSSNSTGIITSSTFSGNAAGASAQGGAINHSGTGSVEITDSTFSGNTAQHGGGVKADSVTLNRSTFTGNTASGVGGALVTWDGTNIYIYNSTVSGNTANGGGAFYTQGNSTIKSSTIANNTASWSGGVHINDAGDTCTVQNTIFNNNGSTCGGSGSITSLGNNIDDNSSCGFTQTGDQQGTDALLEALADNGGPAQTHALQTSSSLSPAIDAGDNTACAASPINNVDQRGETRPADGDGDLTATCDAGAYEYIP
jgi:CSLREA domain-containing protein